MKLSSMIRLVPAHTRAHASVSVSVVPAYFLDLYVDRSR